MSILDYSNLISVLVTPPKVEYPVVLPDFFVDHFVLIPKFEDLMKNLEVLAKQGGGNLLGSTQFIRRGGNCVNTTSALRALKLDAKMIITTDNYGVSLLKALFSQDLDTTNVHVDGRLSSTVSIETEFQKRKINLMLSDSGSASDFRFHDLTDADLQVIRKSGLVALVNLNHNRGGAELAHGLFTMVKTETNALTFMDIGDPSSNPEIIEPLVRNVIGSGLVDVLGLNENEVGWIARFLSGNRDRWHNLVTKPNEWIPGAQLISEETGVDIDLHTQYFAARISDDEVISIPSFEVKSKVACGAGDAWNAGDIYGLLVNIPSSDRLILANAVASLYVSSPNTSHPTPDEVIQFLNNNPTISEHGKKLLMD